MLRVARRRRKNAARPAASPTRRKVKLSWRLAGRGATINHYKFEPRGQRAGREIRSGRRLGVAARMAPPPPPIGRPAIHRGRALPAGACQPRPFRRQEGALSGHFCRPDRARVRPRAQKWAQPRQWPPTDASIFAPCGFPLSDCAIFFRQRARPPASKEPPLAARRRGASPFAARSPTGPPDRLAGPHGRPFGPAILEQRQINRLSCGPLWAADTRNSSYHHQGGASLWVGANGAPRRPPSCRAASYCVRAPTQQGGQQFEN